MPVTVRYESRRVADLLRVAAAAARTGSKLAVSSSEVLSSGVQSYLESIDAEVAFEDATDWARRAGRLADEGGRVRLIGADRAVAAAATGGSPAVAIYAGDVVSAGRVELLPFLREQAVSITAHRFGTPRRYEIPPAV
jgi:RHH-type transcriptional regulator, proline utilization regulon repressor / proline dehydrogenase / delta 1-pyrroline-5-carboxylate dehydrogenase